MLEFAIKLQPVCKLRTIFAFLPFTPKLFVKPYMPPIAAIAVCSIIFTLINEPVVVVETTCMSPERKGYSTVAVFTVKAPTPPGVTNSI